jgi:ABC-type Fe3+-hydroxamate transport system substrate-binding protein
MTFTDQMGQVIELNQPPQRIISLVPSQTELLFDLGLDASIVGLTKFCIHPKQQVKTKTKIGGTKNFNFDIIRQLQPDLIIGNKEENYEEGILALQQQHTVWMSDIITLTDALYMIKGIGQLTGTNETAAKITRKITQRFSELKGATNMAAAYLIWKDPYMSVGHNTFIHQVLVAAGFRNVFEQQSRYPLITPAELQEAAPKVIFLSSEPYPFKEKHIREIQEILPQALIKLVDGELFSWYGSRLLQTPAYLSKVRQEVEAALNC